MISSATNSKSDLRAKIRAALKKISPAVRAVESIDLCERLKAQMPSAHTILFFAPLPDELDVWPVLELSMALGTTCALPVFDAAKKLYGARGLEPACDRHRHGKIRRARTGGKLRGNSVWKNLIWCWFPDWRLI